jgi:hypothetical protein
VSYSANFSSCEAAKISVGERNPARWIEPWLKVARTASSSSATSVLVRLRSPSVEPERRWVGVVGW